MPAHETISEPKTKRKINLLKIVRECMDGCENYQQGAKVLLARAKKDPVLMSAIVEPFEYNACVDAIRRCMSEFRTRLLEEVHSKQGALSPEDGQSRVKALLHVNMLSIYDYPLPGGKKLGDATIDDLKVAKDFHNKSRRAHGNSARWYGRIARMLAESPASTVRERLTEEEVEKARVETEET